MTFFDITLTLYAIR